MINQRLSMLNIGKLIDYLMQPEKQLQANLCDELEELGYEIRLGKDERKNTLYIYASRADRLPVLLVAHTDTVLKQQPKDVYYDEIDHSLSAWDGIGADDRAGVFAIMEIIKNFKCDVLFTSLEEQGLLGAKRFIEDFKENPGYQMLIELDTPGDNYAKFYDNRSLDFQTYILSFGFEISSGKKTDIRAISPQWKINAVNLSAGYLNHHKRSEQLMISYLENVIKKVKSILSEPIPQYPYIEPET
jgi:di/tripeptidase